MATCQIGISIFKQPLKWVAKSVISALSQVGNVDVICTVRIDGPEGCDVETLRWLNNTCRTDERLILILGRNRIGSFASYKVIFSSLHTTYLCQLDADDWLEENAISESVNVLIKNPSAPFAYTNYREVDAQGRFVAPGKRCMLSFSMLSELVEFSTFHLRVIQRWAYARCGGYHPYLKYAGDYDLSLKLAELGKPEKVFQTLYNYRVHDSNSSILNKEPLFDEVFKISKIALSRRNLDHIYKLEYHKEKNCQHKLFKRTGPILIAGMHKSGTSIASLIMQSYGLELGSNLLESNSDNPEGYYEDIDAIKLNRLALKRLGLDPDWGEGKNSSLSQVISHSEWRNLALSYIASRAKSNAIWGWKDPRNSILLNEWMEVNSAIKVLAALRPPWDVVASFSRSKCNFYPRKISKVVKIWCNFNQSILDFKKKYPSQCLIVSTSSIIRSPSEFIKILNTKWDQEFSTNHPISTQKSLNLIRKDKFLSLDLDDERVDSFSSEFTLALHIYEELRENASF